MCVFLLQSGSCVLSLVESLHAGYNSIIHVTENSQAEIHHKKDSTAHQPTAWV